MLRVINEIKQKTDTVLMDDIIPAMDGSETIQKIWLVYKNRDHHQSERDNNKGWPGELYSAS